MERKSAAGCIVPPWDSLSRARLAKLKIELMAVLMDKSFAMSGAVYWKGWRKAGCPTVGQFSALEASWKVSLSACLTLL